MREKILGKVDVVLSWRCDDKYKKNMTLERTVI